MKAVIPLSCSLVPASPQVWSDRVKAWQAVGPSPGNCSLLDGMLRQRWRLAGWAWSTARKEALQQSSSKWNGRYYLRKRVGNV